MACRSEDSFREPRVNGKRLGEYDPVEMVEVGRDPVDGRPLYRNVYASPPRQKQKGLIARILGSVFK